MKYISIVLKDICSELNKMIFKPIKKINNKTQEKGRALRKKKKAILQIKNLNGECDNEI